VHVRELGLLVWIWRDAGGWAAATPRRQAGGRHPTPEQALIAATGSWPHESWIVPTAIAARRAFPHPARLGPHPSRRHDRPE